MKVPLIMERNPYRVIEIALSESESGSDRTQKACYRPDVISVKQRMIGNIEANPTSRCGNREFHFSEVLIDVNFVLSFVPSPLTMAIIASEMPAAMSPYSMAVAAVSSSRNLRSVFIPKSSARNLSDWIIYFRKGKYG
jgi:hypothetical protein